MLKIDSYEVTGWDAAICGMRNPLNSWMQSDSYRRTSDFVLGEKDLALATKLSNAGSDHGKFLRMLVVYVDINAPLYWWKEFDTYKVGTVANSCSTMHKIHANEFTLDDFSHEHLIVYGSEFKVQVSSDGAELSPCGLLVDVVTVLNSCREKYLETKDKKYWWQMIQLLPSSYNQRRTVMLNYAVLKSMYHARKNHKLTEWHRLCDWIAELPYAKELIIGGEK